MAYGFMWESEAVPNLSKAWYRQWLIDSLVPHDHDEPEWMYRLRLLPWLSIKERDQELENLSRELEPRAKAVAGLYCVAASLTAGDIVRAVSLLAQEKPRELHGALFDQSRILVARLHGQRKEFELARRELSSVIADTRFASQRAVAQALIVEFLEQEGLPNSQIERQNAKRESELLHEELALLVTREDREQFWRAPKRRVWKQGGKQQADVAPKGVQDVSAAWRELAQITKGLLLAGERETLLQRITDGAMELTQAERGFLLLCDSNQALQIAARSEKITAGNTSFSLSIAESVLIDGAPILTASAASDPRLSSFLSVHQMALQSVACVPIKNDASVLGVLYIEHRGYAARFDQGHIDVLLAFADLAALTLSLRHLHDTSENQTRALAEANTKLEHAKREIESVLDMRSEELVDARKRLVRARSDGANARHGIIGSSAAMERVIGVVERVQNIGVPVIIRGESGTGKEVIARAIHDGGQRAKKPFVAINCAAIPETLLEAELFGYRRGSFTGADRDKAGLFEKAQDGTLFLDEIADMPERMQAALLRVLAESKVRPLGSDVEVDVNPRILSATQKDLREHVKSGRFREDLYYRLSVVEIVLPPLSSRKSDIAALADHFLDRINAREKQRKHFSKAVRARLESYAWPGNVRELEHVITRAYVMSEDTIEVDDLRLGGDVVETNNESPQPVSRSLPPDSNVAWKDREKVQILEALARSRWNRARAAKDLGMPRRTFYRRLKEFDILVAGDGEEEDEST